MVHTYYYLMIVLLVGFIVALVLAIFENRKVFTFISEGTYYKLAAIVLLGIVIKYSFATFTPKVFNDEFLYISTAENLVRNGLSTPFLEKSFPPTALNDFRFFPPYPQLWPVILSFAFGAMQSFSYQVAGYLNTILSMLIPIPAFFMGYFFFASVNPRIKAEKSGEICGLFTAFFWVFIPVIIKLTGCASSEINSTLMITIYLAFLFLYLEYPTGKTFLAMILSLCLVIHGRPENLLYVLLLIPVLIKGKFRLLREKRNLALIVLFFFMLVSLLILTSGFGDPDRSHVFRIEKRIVFDSKFDNFTANFLNNFLFLAGHNKVHPIFFTLLAIGGILFLIFRKDDRFRGYLLMGWFSVFFFIFSPFPFGDYSNSHSYDAYRFSIHLYFPLTLAMSYCSFALWQMIMNTRFNKIAPALTTAILILIFISFYFSIPFIRVEHPDMFYFDTLGQATEKIKKLKTNIIMVAVKPERCLMIRYITGLPTFMIESKKDVENMKPGDTRIFYYLTGSPPEVILQNFEMNLYVRHYIDKKEYSVFELKKSE